MFVNHTERCGLVSHKRLIDHCAVDLQAEETRKRELRKRGEAKTQTSDAKFDAQFAFGHGLTGQSSQVRF